MTHLQQYRDIDVPDNFQEWSIDARVNYLANSMDHQQIANYVREVTGLEERDQPTFLKDELVEMAIQLQERETDE